MPTLRERAENGTNPTMAQTLAPDLTEAARRDAEAMPAVDVDSSAVPVVAGASVHTAFAGVMADVQNVAKGDQRSDNGGRYAFRGIDRLLNAVGPALRKHGVAIVQESIAPTYDVVMTGGGKPMQRCVAIVTYRVYGPAGDSFPMSSAGEAFDSGDKATPKALSVALRTLYINSLAIPTDGQYDPERGPQAERAVPPPPTAQELADEIQSPKISIPRLQAIRRDLLEHPDMNVSVLTIGGDEVMLMDMLTARGRELQAISR